MTKRRAPLRLLASSLLILLVASCKGEKADRDVAPTNPVIFKTASERLDEIKSMITKDENTSVKCAGAMTYAQNLADDRNTQATALRNDIERTCGYEAPLAGIKKNLERLEHADGGHARECAQARIYFDDFTPQHRDAPEVKALRERYARYCE
jgi:hypothetical protein